jgi:hypothetical protein
VDRSRIDSEKNFCDVLDKVHEISSVTVDDTHVFTLSQVYEGLLLKIGEKGNDGGQFFTPREVIRAMVRVVDPKIKQTVYDPGCGTGGFLAQSYEYMKAQAGDTITGPGDGALRDEREPGFPEPETDHACAGQRVGGDARGGGLIAGEAVHDADRRPDDERAERGPRLHTGAGRVHQAGF